MPTTRFWLDCTNILYQDDLLRNLRTKCASELTRPDVPETSSSRVLQVWGVGLLCVTAINACACLGVVIHPCMKSKAYFFVQAFLISLAVGTLLASALLVLIPDSMDLAFLFEFNHNFVSYKYRLSAVLLSVYAFFLIERGLKTLLATGWMRRRLAGGPREEDTDSQLVAFKSQPMEMEPLTAEQSTAIRPSGAHSHHADLTMNTGSSVRSIGLMIILGDAVHNFVDGLCLGAAFSRDLRSGLSFSLAVLFEELPHELGDFAVLLNSGFSLRGALLANLLSASTCYLGFALGAAISDWSQAAAQWMMACAGGMFLYISLVDMLPEAIQVLDAEDSRTKGIVKIFFVQNVGLFAGYFLISILSFYSSEIQL